jgi:hypothetical protein
MGVSNGDNYGDDEDNVSWGQQEDLVNYRHKDNKSNGGRGRLFYYYEEEPFRQADQKTPYALHHTTTLSSHKDTSYTYRDSLYEPSDENSHKNIIDPNNIQLYELTSSNKASKTEYGLSDIWKSLQRITQSRTADQLQQPTVTKVKCTYSLLFPIILQ